MSSRPSCPRSLLSLALAACALLPASVRADVISPGHRGVPHDVLVAIDPAVRDDVAWQTLVEEGETLGGIALRTLGDAKRAAQIAKWNELEDPDRVVPGQVLWIPPKEGANEHRKYRLYFTFDYPFGHLPEPVVVGRALPFFKWGLELVAVEEGQVEAFLEEARRRDPAKGGKEEQGDPASFPEGSVLRSGDLDVVREVAVLSTVKAYTTTFTVTSLAAREKLEVRAQRRRGRAGEEDEAPVQEAMLVSVAAASLLAIGWTARRRRTAGTAQS